MDKKEVIARAQKIIEAQTDVITLCKANLKTSTANAKVNDAILALLDATGSHAEAQDKAAQSREK